MVMKKSEFIKLFTMLYGERKRLVVTGVRRYAGYDGIALPKGVPVLCWRAVRGEGVVVGVHRKGAGYDEEVKPVKLMLMIGEYFKSGVTSQTSQNFPKLPNDLGSHREGVK